VTVKKHLGTEQKKLEIRVALKGLMVGLSTMKKEYKKCIRSNKRALKRWIYSTSLYWMFRGSDEDVPTRVCGMDKTTKIFVKIFDL